MMTCRDVEQYAPCVVQDGASIIQKKRGKMNDEKYTLLKRKIGVGLVDNKL